MKSGLPIEQPYGNLVKVIYVLGSAHSGTTLLSLLLTSNSNVFAGGHLRDFRRLYTETDHLRCDCGVGVKDCDFWRKVLSKLKDQEYRRTAEGQKYRKREVETFYRTLLYASGAHAICDSSLNQSYLKFLESTGFVKTYIVNIVRDGRAVWYSHIRKHNRKITIPFSWMITNIKKWWRHRGRRNYCLIRYEDVTEDPKRHIEEMRKKITDFFGDGELFPGGGHDEFFSFENHIFSANRMRHVKSAKIRRDTEYIESCSNMKWLFGTLFMAPALILLGYPLRRSRMATKMGRRRGPG